jgi:hypothetical protein
MGKTAAKNAEIKPYTMPILCASLNSNITKIPKITNNPSNTSIKENGLLVINGSKIEEKNPIAEKHTSAIEILEYLIEP